MNQSKLLLFWLLTLITACTPNNTSPPAQITPAAAISLTTAAPTLAPTTPPTSLPTAKPTNPPPATATPIPTTTSTPTPTITATPSPTPTATPAPLCTDRIPSDEDLLVIVNFAYGLSEAYEPADLVSIDQYFPFDVTKGYPTQVRSIIIEPLQAMITDMQAAGLQPQIISGYRSHYSQGVAYEKWLEREPERATQLSARPGHSEHQLGTTIDFGSPVLYQYVEDADETIEFHTYFYKTPEGEWLLANAHTYGFTLSYPREAQNVTGFYYEPWHYRYVGPDMATFLKDNNISLTEYLLVNNPAPCEA